MSRLLTFLADYWLLVALVAIVVVAVARVGFGRRPRIIWPVAAILLIGGHFLFANVCVAPLKPWEFSAWIAIGVVWLFLLVAINLLFTGLWSRHLAWVIAALFAIALGGLVGTAQAAGLTAARSLGTLEFVQPWWLLLLL